MKKAIKSSKHYLEGLYVTDGEIGIVCQALLSAIEELKAAYKALDDLGFMSKDGSIVCKEFIEVIKKGDK